MKDTNDNFLRQSAWYPRHVSDRADELIDEPGEAQLRQLYDALKTITVGEWMTWLSDFREEICEYDALRPAERKRLLQPVAPSVPIDALRLHHACIFVELWRTRMNNDYFHLPPRGMPIDDPESQREMMLAVVASYYEYDAHDLWPFELPDDETGLPFCD